MKKIWPLVLGLLVCATLPAYGKTKKPEPIKVEVAVSVSLVSASSEPDPTKASCAPDHDVRTSELCAAWKSADAAAGIDWETLLVGFMSGLAAIFAGVLLLRQINQTEKHERFRLNRKFIAARATLPLALTELCDFCKRSTDQLKPVYIYMRSTMTTPAPPFELQSIPDNVMTIINALLESTPHDTVADRLSDMLAMIQVFQSRLKSLRDSNLNAGFMNRDETIQSYIINSGELYALASSLFDYAREKTDFGATVKLGDLTYDTVLDAFRSFEMYSLAFDPIRDTVNRYCSEGFKVAWEIF